MAKDTFWCSDCGRVLCDSHRYQHTCERLDAMKEKNVSWQKAKKGPGLLLWECILLVNRFVVLEVAHTQRLSTQPRKGWKQRE